MKYRFKHVVEYGLLRSVTGLAGLLPYRVALAIGYLLAVLTWHPWGARRRAALARLAEVFGDRFQPGEYRGIAWHAWRNLFFNVVEIMRLPRLTPQRIAQMAVMEDEVARSRISGQAMAPSSPYRTWATGIWPVWRRNPTVC